MPEQHPRRDPCAHLGYLPTAQVAVDVRVQIESALVDEPQDAERGNVLADRAALEGGRRRHADIRTGCGGSKTAFPDHVACVDERHAGAGAPLEAEHVLDPDRVAPPAPKWRLEAQVGHHLLRASVVHPTMSFPVSSSVRRAMKSR